jgi:hypothetical protein
MVAPIREVMPDPEIHVLVGRWRARAQENLAQADAMRDAEARLTMREIAAKYDVLARRIEQQIRQEDRA